VQPLESTLLHQHIYQLHYRYYNPHQPNRSSLSNTAVPTQDTVTDLASYRRLLDALTNADYAGTGVGLQRRSCGATRASDEMVITIDGEALVAYCAVAAQAATEANQICLDAALAAQGAALHVANEIANNGWCALTAKPIVDQADQVDRACTWGNDKQRDFSRQMHDLTLSNRSLRW